LRRRGTSLERFKREMKIDLVWRGSHASGIGELLGGLGNRARRRRGKDQSLNERIAPSTFETQAKKTGGWGKELGKAWKAKEKRRPDEKRKANTYQSSFKIGPPDGGPERRRSQDVQQWTKEGEDLKKRHEPLTCRTDKKSYRGKRKSGGVAALLDVTEGNRYQEDDRVDIGQHTMAQIAMEEGERSED